MKKKPSKKRPAPKKKLSIFTPELFYFKGQPICGIWIEKKTKVDIRLKCVMARGSKDGEIIYDFQDGPVVLFDAIVHWDGCTDLQLGKKGYYHLCGLDDLDFIPELFKRINVIRKKLLRSAA